MFKLSSIPRFLNSSWEVAANGFNNMSSSLRILIGAFVESDVLMLVVLRPHPSMFSLLVSVPSALGILNIGIAKFS